MNTKYIIIGLDSRPHSRSIYVCIHLQIESLLVVVLGAHIMFPMSRVKQLCSNCGYTVTGKHILLLNLVVCLGGGSPISKSPKIKSHKISENKYLLSPQSPKIRILSFKTLLKYLFPLFSC